MPDVLNEDLKPTTQTSNFRLMAVFFVGAPVLLFLGMVLANRFMPDAADATLYKTTLAAMLGGGGLSALIGTVTQSVKRTDGKIAVQVAKATIPSKYGGLIDMAGGLVFRDKTGDDAADVDGDEIPAAGEGFIQNGDS